MPPGGGDRRKSFILATTGNFFALPPGDESLEGQKDARALDAFLDDGSVNVLAVKRDGARLALTNKVRTFITLFKVLLVLFFI